MASLQPKNPQARNLDLSIQLASRGDERAQQAASRAAERVVWTPDSGLLQTPVRSNEYVCNYSVSTGNLRCAGTSVTKSSDSKGWTAHATK